MVVYRLKSMIIVFADPNDIEEDDQFEMIRAYDSESNGLRLILVKRCPFTLFISSISRVIFS